MKTLAGNAELDKLDERVFLIQYIYSGTQILTSYQNLIRNRVVGSSLLRNKTDDKIEKEKT
jgi:hypothetical protein